MTLATRYVGNNWYGHFVTATGTCTLSGDQRSFEWSREGETVDATASADATRGVKVLFRNETFALSLLATTDGTASWNSYFVPNTEGTIVFSEGDGTADGKPKNTCPVIVTSCSSTMPYDGMVEWSVEWNAQGALTAGTWSAGA